jgi:molybdopterin synthase catalytic subunit
MFRLCDDPIDINSLRDALVSPEDGAVVIFEGIVRNHARGKRVRCLEYRAYDVMALKQLEEIGAALKKEFPIRDIGIVHRLGRLNPTDCSVAIVVVAAHRTAAFSACRSAIDAIKKNVPIWKKEFYEDGEVWIEGPS